MTQHTQAPTALEAKSFPEHRCPEEPAQAMIFVGQIWSVNIAARNTSTAGHSLPLECC